MAEQVKPNCFKIAAQCNLNVELYILVLITRQSMCDGRNPYQIKLSSFLPKAWATCSASAEVLQNSGMDLYCVPLRNETTRKKEKSMFFKIVQKII